MKTGFQILSGSNHNQEIIAKALQIQNRYALAERRSPILGFYNSPPNNIISLPYNYQTLINLWLNNEVTRTVGEAIIKEVEKKAHMIQAKWQCKCNVCGSEFKNEKKVCSECDGTDFTYPDPLQRQIAEAFDKRPNSDNTVSQINESLLRYMLSVDDHWVSYQAGNISTLKAPTIQVEDSVYMRVVWTEETGRIGNGEYFCPICTREDPAASYNLGEHCVKHPDVKLQETAYVYDKGGVKARFARDEIYHGMIDPWLPGFYGNSRLISALRIVLSVAAMDRFNYDNYSTGKLAQILVFMGLSQPDANDLAVQVKKQIDSFGVDGKEEQLRTLLIGGKDGVAAVDAMPPSDKMQSLDWWKLWREAYCGLYGVTPIMAGIVDSGKTGNNPRMQIDVDNNTVEHFQASIEAIYNTFIYPKLGVTDWEWVYCPIEEKDEIQEVTVLNSKLDAMAKAVNLGLDVELTDEGELKVSGEPYSLEEKNQMQMDQFAAQAKLKPQQDSGNEHEQKDKPGFQNEKPFTTEKAVAGEWLVTKLEKKNKDKEKEKDKDKVEYHE